MTETETFEYFSQHRNKTLVDVTLARPTDLMNLGEDRHPDLYEDVSIGSVLAELTEKQLERLVTEKNYHVRIPRRDNSGISKKEMIVSVFEGVIIDHEIKNFTPMLSKKLLVDLTARVDYDHLTKNFKPKEKGSIPKTVYQKRFYEWLVEYGFTTYMRKMSCETLKDTISYLGYEPLDVEKRTPLANQLTEILHVQALQNCFSTVSPKLLKDILKHMGLYCTSTSKSKMIDCIVFGTCYSPDPIPEKKGTKLSKKPKSITKKLKKVDLEYWFLAAELKEFCADHHLVQTGKKTALAQRIVNFFDPEKENEVPQKKGKKSGKSAKQKSAKKAKLDPLFSASSSDSKYLKERKRSPRKPKATATTGITFSGSEQISSESDSTVEYEPTNKSGKSKGSSKSGEKKKIKQTGKDKTSSNDKHYSRRSSELDFSNSSSSELISQTPTLSEVILKSDSSDSSLLSINIFQFHI